MEAPKKNTQATASFDERKKNAQKYADDMFNRVTVMDYLTKQVPSAAKGSQTLVTPEFKKTYTESLGMMTDLEKKIRSEYGDNFTFKSTTEQTYIRINDPETGDVLVEELWKSK